MYQEVCCSNISSGIIKNMKFDPRNKWGKVVSLNLNTSCYRGLIRSSTQAQSIKNYDFKFLRSELRSMITWIIRVSLFTTLIIYDAYFKSHQVRKQRPKTHIFYVKLLRLCTLGFCNQVLLDLYRQWSEEFCSQQQSIKLLELITYWDPCKGVSHKLKICAK